MHSILLYTSFFFSLGFLSATHFSSHVARASSGWFWLLLLSAVYCWTKLELQNQIFVFQAFLDLPPLSFHIYIGYYRRIISLNQQCKATAHQPLNWVSSSFRKCVALIFVAIVTILCGLVLSQCLSITIIIQGRHKFHIHSALVFFILCYVLKAHITLKAWMVIKDL